LTFVLGEEGVQGCDAVVEESEGATEEFGCLGFVDED